MKHQRVGKYYENDCVQNFNFYFKSLLTAQFVRNSGILGRIYFIFLKNVLKETGNTFNTKFRLQWKDWKSSFQVREILALSWNSISLTTRQNSVRSLGATKMVKEIKFEEFWGKKCQKFFSRADRLISIWDQL